MSFARNLKTVMLDQNINQTDLSRLTGIGKSSLSQYLSGKNLPHTHRIVELATTLNVPVSRLTVNMQPTQEELPPINLNQKISIEEAARRLGKSQQFVRVALQNGAAPFGFATKVSGNSYDYHISPKLLGEYIGEKADLSGERSCATCC